MKEADIIKLLASCSMHKQRYELMIPNCYTAHDNEADFFAVRKSGLCDEFEIKVTRSDLLNDKKKIVHYRDWGQGEYYNWLVRQGDRPNISPVQKLKYDALKTGETPINYFWYVLKDGIGGIEDIPDWAGLMIARKNSILLKVVRAPKKLKREKLDFEQRYKFAKKMQFRYWGLMEKLELSE